MQQLIVSHQKKIKMFVATHRNRKLEKLKQIYRQRNNILSWQCLQFSDFTYHKAKILWIVNVFGCSASNDLSADFDAVSNIQLCNLPVYPCDQRQYEYEKDSNSWCAIFSVYFHNSIEMLSLMKKKNFNKMRLHMFSSSFSLHLNIISIYIRIQSATCVICYSIFSFECVSNRLLNEFSFFITNFVWRNVGIWNSVGVRQCFVDENSIRIFEERQSSKFNVENHHLRRISSHLCAHHPNDICSF